MIKLPEPRKAYTCAACDHTYLDAPVTGCDCMPVENKFTEENLYTEAQLKQAIRDVLESAAIEAWNHYMDTCKKTRLPASAVGYWIASARIRKLKEQL
jgi:hypothetical protein